MNLIVTRALSALVVALFLVGVPAHAQTTHRDPGAYATFTMPKDWKQAQPDKLDDLKIDKSVTNVQFRAAFAKTLKNGVPELPYMIVALQPASMRGINFENIEDKYASELRTPVFGTQQVGEADFYSNAIVHYLAIAGPKSKDIKAVVYSFPTKDGLVHLACFEDAKRFEKTEEVFHDAAVSCKIDQVKEFKPSSGGYSRSGRRGMFGIGGLGIGFVLLILRYWASR